MKTTDSTILKTSNHDKTLLRPVNLRRPFMAMISVWIAMLGIVVLPGQADARILTTDEVAEYCYDAGFRGNGLVKAIAVAWGESSFDTNNHNVNLGPPRSDDWGLFQFNSYWHPNVTKAMAINPATAAREAYKLSKQGTKWTDWYAYQGSQYNAKLSDARAAADRITAIKTINRSAQAISDCQRAARADSRFKTMIQNSLVLQKTENGVEYRTVEFQWKPNWLITTRNRVWHVTVKADPRIRATCYYDTSRNAFTPWVHR